jgi:hypothetical protein
VLRVIVACDHTQRHALRRTPLDQWSARPRLIPENTHAHNRKTSETLAGFLLFCFLNSFVLFPYMFLCPLLYNTNIYACTLFVLHPYLAFCLHCTAFCHTNNPAPGWIRTRNPSRRSAGDPRLRTLGQRDRPSQDSLNQLRTAEWRKRGAMLSCLVSACYVTIWLPFAFVYLRISITRC